MTRKSKRIVLRDKRKKGGKNQVFASAISNIKISTGFQAVPGKGVLENPRLREGRHFLSLAEQAPLGELKPAWEGNKRKKKKLSTRKEWRLGDFSRALEVFPMSLSLGEKGHGTSPRIEGE